MVTGELAVADLCASNARHEPRSCGNAPLLYFFFGAIAEANETRTRLIRNDGYDVGSDGLTSSQTKGVATELDPSPRCTSETANASQRRGLVRQVV